MVCSIPSVRATEMNHGTDSIQILAKEFNRSILARDSGKEDSVVFEEIRFFKFFIMLHRFMPDAAGFLYR